MTTVAPPTWPLSVKPWPWQPEAVRYVLGRPGSLLDIGMGGGKGAIVIAALELRQCGRVLVVCPNNVVGVWPRELRDHGLRDWSTWNGEARGVSGKVLKSPSVARRAGALHRAFIDAAAMRRPFAAIVNFEACHQGDMGRLVEGGFGTAWDAVILDESHRMKAPGGKISRFLARACNRVRAGGGLIVGATGTALTQSPLDAYGQLRAIDPAVLGTSYARVTARFGAPKVLYTRRDGTDVYLGVRGNHVPADRIAEYLTEPGAKLIFDGVRDDRMAEYTDRLARAVFHVDQDVIDREQGLLEPISTYRTCTLEPATRKVYTRLERDYIAQVDEGTIVAANAMVAQVRLAQVANGFARTEDERHVPICDPPEKARLLADVLEDIDPREPVVVFGRFHSDLDSIERVAAQLKRHYAELSGRRRDALTADARLIPGAAIIGVQPQAGGVGVDFTRARYGVYYSLGFSLVDYLQSRKRLHRPGQDRGTVFVHLLAESTVDGAIYTALRQRRDVNEAVHTYLRKGS